jgi:hypothetical protein
LEAFLQGPVLRGEFAGALVQGGVAGAEAPNGVKRLVGFEIADAAEHVRDGLSLGSDLAMGHLEGVLRVACPLPPRLVLGGLAVVGVSATASAAFDGVADSLTGTGVLVKEGAGHAGSVGDGGEGYGAPLALKPVDGPR